MSTGILIHELNQTQWKENLTVNLHTMQTLSSIEESLSQRGWQGYGRGFLHAPSKTQTKRVIEAFYRSIIRNIIEQYSAVLNLEDCFPPGHCPPSEPPDSMGTLMASAFGRSTNSDLRLCASTARLPQKSILVKTEVTKTSNTLLPGC